MGAHPKRARAAPRPGPRAAATDLLGEPEKRRAILHAAVRVFADKGYHGCRIADVARQAGVAYGLVYHYFRNKEALLEKVFEEQWAIFLAAVRAIREGPGSSAERLAGVCRFAVDVLKTAPAAVRVLLLEMARTPNVVRAGHTRQTFEDALRLVAEMIADGQKADEIRREIDPMVAAAGLLGALELTLTAMVLGTVPSGTEAEVERAKQQVVAFVLLGLRSER